MRADSSTRQRDRESRPPAVARAPRATTPPCCRQSQSIPVAAWGSIRASWRDVCRLPDIGQKVLIKVGERGALGGHTTYRRCYIYRRRHITYVVFVYLCRFGIAAFDWI